MSGVADIVSMEEARSRRAPLQAGEFSTAGAMLRAAREALGLSLEEISQSTNIKIQHLDALEQMDLARLPAAPYTTGFVKAYATQVELPVEALVKRYREEAGFVTQTVAPKIEIRQADDLRPAQGMSLMAILAIVAFILWCAWQITRPAEDTGPVVLDGYPITERPTDTPSVVFEAKNDLPQVNPSKISVLNTELSQRIQSAVTTYQSQQQALAIETEQASVSAPQSLPTQDTGLPVVAAETPVVDRVQQELDALAQNALTNDTLTPAIEEVTLPEITQPDPQSEQLFPRVEPLLVAATPLNQVSPVYPNRCQRRASDREVVLVGYDISPAGRATNVRILETTNECFNNAASSAIARWTFSPALENGNPVTATGQATTFNFALE